MTNDMMIRVTQLEGDAKTKMTFLVEGSLNFTGAQLLASVCQQAALQTKQVSIDLSGVAYLDESSATLLCWLRRQPKVSLTGCNLFTGLVLEEAETATSLVG